MSTVHQNPSNYRSNATTATEKRPVRPVVNLPAPLLGVAGSDVVASPTGRPLAGVGTLPVGTLPREVEMVGAAPVGEALVGKLAGVPAAVFVAGVDAGGVAAPPVADPLAFAR